MDARAANRLGAQRYFTDRGVYRNPFAPGSPEFDAFERGWMQALKGDDARLAERSLHLAAAAAGEG